ncbi:uncharacterized protein LOC131164981 [Malania oleifera]|uniref:uncharacterized protein LOC131164981 n=1 Tax=Malania oleifera TaxID=397392 RepID=UPI0025ADA300|nr:uncharacterized protein LOC131164981 [Malania oleifera]
MGILRRIAGFLGFGKDDLHEARDDDEDDEDEQINRVNTEEARLPRKGFGVPVQVAVERAPVGPVLVPCSSADGGVQGLQWYAKRLRVDEDGDVADEFLGEVSPETSNAEDHQRPLPRFEVKYRTRPAKVRSQVMSPDGKVQQCVECQGRLRWV